MRTGSPALWALGEVAGVVPQPPDDQLAALLASWWTRPRKLGCVSATSGPWAIVAPDPSAWCPDCAADRFAVERRCAYCGRLVNLSRSLALVFEMNHDVKVLGRAHRHCSERARARTR